MIDCSLLLAMTVNCEDAADSGLIPIHVRSTHWKVLQKLKKPYRVKVHQILIAIEGT